MIDQMILYIKTRVGRSDLDHVVTVLMLVSAYNVDILLVHGQNAEAFAVMRRVACESC